MTPEIWKEYTYHPLHTEEEDSPQHHREDPILGRPHPDRWYTLDWCMMHLYCRERGTILILLDTCTNTKSQHREFLMDLQYRRNSHPLSLVWEEGNLSCQHILGRSVDSIVDPNRNWLEEYCSKWICKLKNNKWNIYSICFIMISGFKLNTRIFARIRYNLAILIFQRPLLRQHIICVVINGDWGICETETRIKPAWHIALKLYTLDTPDPIWQSIKSSALGNIYLGSCIDKMVKRM